MTDSVWFIHETIFKLVNWSNFLCKGDDLSFVSIKSAAHQPRNEFIPDCVSVTLIVTSQCEKFSYRLQTNNNNIIIVILLLLLLLLIIIIIIIINSHFVEVKLRKENSN